ncbi:endoribonuclease Dicer homolog 3a isoform X2 [Selaginella moellendorffii]|uniref:endoribonuclease Dicer homolog 3a isoform X2 n=1 Tax=Selaginella moellendorffii TaxID=88036 RepID=UPI000D1CA86E|nr:endoribonuclease Dicer homolog 3a isoform X2 [Selaginella moellendorffii]|eukprot:XP_024528687.1 endoribonuclease Dicer homolog 3a isoform X2 [Selaginella moellendorffii]
MEIPDEDDPLVLKSKKRKAEKQASKAKKSKIEVTEKCEIIAAPAAQVARPAVVDFEPRSYQLEVLEKVLKENTIVFLETGAGKTHIAAMLFNKLADRLSMPEEKRIGVFLTPTVALADQQANVISSSTRLKVGIYHGGQMDTWDVRKWSEEIDSHQVLVMTAQVLFNSLQLSAIRMEMIEVLIFDECHRAQNNHPYASVMKTYYHTSTSKLKPRIFGMTGSLVATKVSTCEDGKLCKEMRDLESLLDSKIYTITSRAELEEKVPTPFYRNLYYDKAHHCFKELRRCLTDLLDKYQQSSCVGTCQLSDENKKRSKFSNLYNAITSCLLDLGLWSAVLAVEVLLKIDPEGTKPSVENEDKNDEQRFLKEAYNILKSFVPGDSVSSISSPEDAKKAVNSGLITSKVKALLKILVRYRNVEPFRCMIFVERVVVTQVLARLLSTFKAIDFCRTGYIVGVTADGNTTKHVETVKAFKSGELNVLICTSVAEEGLDVQSCNCVVRFDICRTLRSFIQSRGRGRKRDATYMFLLERGNLEQESLLMELVNSEELMRAEALSRMSKTIEITPLIDADLDFFYTTSGACISTDGAVSFIYRYCSQLPGDRFYNPKPEIEVTKCESDNEELFSCTITFPPNAPLHVLTGLPKRNKQLAKKVACLEACRQLDALGALGERHPPEVREEKMASEGPGLGSTKLKELFPSIKSTTYQRQWITTSTDIVLHIYALIFHPEENGSTYTNFGLLFDAALDDDVGNIEVNLYLTKNRAVKAKLSSAGQRRVDSVQLAAAKAYQEIMFNGAFSRLVFREDKNDRTLATCLLSSTEKANELWSETYLLLPILDGSCDIDWNIVTRCADAAKLLPSLCSELNKTEVCMERPDTGLIYTASGPVSPGALQDAVVLTVHTGKLFSIVEVLEDLGAQSTFKENEESEPCTYEEFYLRKHGRLLRYQTQPFLRVKPTHAVHNHLHEPDRKNKQKPAAIVKNFVEIPPELCLVLGARSSMIRSLYLVPSFMYRFTAYIISSELRTKFTKHFPCAHASKILEARTSLRCQDGFSYEGLELLGDSVLKYAVTRKLYLLHSTMHEGELSDRRSHAICNSTLRKLAVAQDLPMYVRDEPFYPSCWVGAGMYRQRSRKCCCRLDNLVTKESSKPRPTDATYYVGKTCGQGHRWMCSKTTSDALEALIGAYAVGGGFDGALEFMKALQVDVDFDSGLIAASQHRPVPLDAVQFHMPALLSLEKELCYTFQNKALLLEAITHASTPDTVFCYQRLEFIGDAVLDFLVTRHLFTSHPGLSPGLLSDLRSASVNNDCLARVAVKHRLHSYLRHGSAELRAKITSFLDVLDRDPECSVMFGFKALSGPKALADIVESVAGAILVDSGFDFEKLWVVLKRLLSPFVTPATLSFHPVREFHELCSYKSWEFEWVQSSSGATAEILLKAGEQRFTEVSSIKNKKDARKDVAEKLLTMLKDLGHRHPRWDSLAQEEDGVPSHENALELKGMQDEQMRPRSGANEQTICNMEITNFSGQEVSEQLPLQIDVTEEQMTCNLTITDCSGQEKIDITEKNTRNVETTDYSGQVEHNQAHTSSKCFVPIRNLDVDLESLTAVRTEMTNCAIALLQDFCSQRKLGSPKFEAKERRGVAQGRWFSFTVSVEIPGEGFLEQVSCFMANKERAMGDAAKKMLQLLSSFASSS